MASRVIVIGTGPAGVRAAAALVAAGVRPIVIDEGLRDGGQIYRRQPEGFTRDYQTLYGTEAARAKDLHSTFERLLGKIDYRPNTLVWNISPGMLHLVTGAQYDTLPFDSLIVCSGATDRLIPVKGWQLAGTYSLGAAQVALKSQGCAIGGAVAFMGTGPLLYLVASQYLKAGANVVGVLDTSTMMQRFKALPKLLSVAGAVMNGWTMMRALRQAKVPIYSGVKPAQILGSPIDGVRGVSVTLSNGRIRDVACDAVALGYHMRAETQLADLAGCHFTFHDASRQWLPVVDEDGRSSVSGVYLAGDGARVRGAQAAERAGQLAALALLQDTAQGSTGATLAPATATVAQLRAELVRYTRFADGLREAFPWPVEQAANLPDDAVVCRCESITAGELRRVVRDTGACEANRAKAFSRVGMGRCQGRYCAHTGAELIAAAANVSIESVGRLRGQAPVKPLPMSLIEAAQ